MARKVFIEAIAGPRVGMGHLYRAARLALELERCGALAEVIAPDWAPARDTLARLGIRNVARDVAPCAGDVWILDRFETPRAHALDLIGRGVRLVALDDAGEGAAHSELHIAALPAHQATARPGKRFLTGFGWLILDPEIARHRRERPASGPWAISFGGVDRHRASEAAARALKEAGLRPVVFLGPGYVEGPGTADAFQDLEVQRGVSSLAQALAPFSFLICNGGVTPFEANAAGLPAAIIATEPWEATNARALAERGGALFLGDIEKGALEKLAVIPPIIGMSAKALAAIDGRGLERVAAEILAL